VTVDWQVEGSAAELYQRLVVPAMTGMWAADLVERAAPPPGARVLDVACGTGVVARLAAERVGDAGHVAAVDLNPDMLAVARSLPPVAGASIEWHEGSALALPFEGGSFDVVLCQLGLQFFPDRPAALAEMRRVLGRPGRLALSVYSPIERNPAPHALVEALDRRGERTAVEIKRAEHALGDPDELRTLVSDAGFAEIEVETVVKVVRLASVADYVRIQRTATPIGAAVADRDRVFDDLVEELSAALAPYVGPEGLGFPQESHVALAAGPVDAS
jgi:ubiquinone/menaquinone biosynthesis C-methylase UbiE